MHKIITLCVKHLAQTGSLISKNGGMNLYVVKIIVVRCHDS